MLIIRKTYYGGARGDDAERRAVSEFMQSAHGLPMRERLWTPKCDVYETPETLDVYVELPGVSEEDVQIVFDVENGILAVSGRRDKPDCGRRKRVHLMEMQWGPFEKMLRVAARVGEGDVTATLRNGLLHVVMRKQVLRERCETGE